MIDLQQKSKKHGGKRSNAGRPKGNRHIPLLIRISEEANEKLSKVDNKAECIDELIRKYLK